MQSAAASSSLTSSLKKMVLDLSCLPSLVAVAQLGKRSVDLFSFSILGLKSIMPPRMTPCGMPIENLDKRTSQIPIYHEALSHTGTRTCRQDHLRPLEGYHPGPFDGTLSWWHNQSAFGLFKCF